MEWFEWFAIIGGAIAAVAAVFLEIRHRDGLDERIAVVESQISGVPEAVAAHGERLAALEAVKASPYREPPDYFETHPQPDDRCPCCGRFRKKDQK